MRRSSWSWGRLLGAFGSRKSKRHCKGNCCKKPGQRSFSIEPLEERALLSINPYANEGLVNSYLSATQRLFDSGNAVAAMPDGGCVATWTSQYQDGDNKGIYAQRFDGTGAAVGNEFLVNSTTDDTQQRSSVAVAEDGSFVIVWESFGQDGDGKGIFGQRYAANGQAVGSEFQVNQTTQGDQETPTVACLADHGFIVIWGGRGDGDSSGVFGRRYDADGDAVGDEFLINTETSDQQQLPTVAALPDSEFIVAWQSHGAQEGDCTGIFAQRFDADCDAVGSEFQVNTTTTGHQQYPAIGVGPAGEYTIAWQSNQDVSGWGIFAQRYSANGTAVGSEFQVNGYTDNDQQFPSVAYNDKGGFTVSWSGKGATDNQGIYAREYDSDGTALGGEQLINDTTDNAQEFATVTSASSGYVVVWSGKGDGDNDGVFMRQLGSAPTASGVEDLSVHAGRVSSAVDLWSAFDDEENADWSLSYQITDNTNPDLFALIQIDTETGQLSLSYAVGAEGDADLTVRATDPGGLYVETTFTTTVSDETAELHWTPLPGSSVWDTETANWTDGEGFASYWVAGDGAVFDGTGYTVTVSGTVAAQSVLFSASGYTISSGALALDENGIEITVDSGVTATITSTISGEGELTKTGSGTLVLCGEDSYSGGTAIEAGTLQISSTGSLVGDAAVSAGSLTLIGDAQIDGDLTVSADGTVTFDGGGTITGDATIAGTLAFTTGTAEVGGTLSMLGGPTLTTSLNAGQSVVTHGLYVQRTVALSGGTLDLSGGNIAVDYYNGGDGQFLSGTLKNVGELGILIPGPTLYPVPLVKGGAGTLTLDGENTYSGGTTVQAGVLQIADSGSIDGNVTVSGGEWNCSSTRRLTET